MSEPKLFLDNPEKLAISAQDIVPGTNVAAGTDVFFRFSTIRDWILGQVPVVEPGGSWFGPSAPEDPFEGQLWFDSSNNNKLWRWNGTEWEDVQYEVTLGAFGTGIMPVLVLDELPSEGTPGAVVFLQSDYRIYRWNGSSWTAETQAADIVGQLVGSQIADAALTVAKFASGIRPVEIVATLPSSGNVVGRTVVLTTDQKLYRWNGTAWTAAVPAADVTGQLTNAQIADVAAAKLTGQITTTQISDDAVSTPKLAAGAVSTAKLAAGAVTADTIAANAVTTAKLAAGAVTADQVAANAITTAKLDANAVTTAKLAAGAITADQIAAGAVQATHIAADAVTASKIAANTIQAYHIEAGSVTADKLAANVITAGAIQAGSITADKIGTNEIIAVAANIKDGVITSAKIANLEAGKIVAGNIGAINISHSGKVYNSAVPSVYFPTLTRASRPADTASFSGTGFAFTHAPSVRLYGPGHASAPANPDNIVNVRGGSILVQLTTNIVGPDITTAVWHTVYARKNGTGSWLILGSRLAHFGQQFTTTRGVDIFVGATVNDYFDFYVAPCDINGDIDYTSPVTTYIDVLAFNW
jgi:hypothetical protein